MADPGVRGVRRRGAAQRLVPRPRLARRPARPLRPGRRRRPALPARGLRRRRRRSRGDGLRAGHDRPAGVRRSARPGTGSSSRSTRPTPTSRPRCASALDAAPPAAALGRHRSAVWCGRADCRLGRVADTRRARRGRPLDVRHRARRRSGRRRRRSGPAGRHDGGARAARARRRGVPARRLGDRRGRVPGRRGHRSRGAAATARRGRRRRSAGRSASASAGSRSAIPIRGRASRCAAARGLWLAFNGELYNADAIRDELRGAGRAFRSPGDTEVFLAAWEAWGPDALAAPERDVGVRRVGRAAPPAVVRPRSARHQAALPGADAVGDARRVDAGRDRRRPRRAARRRTRRRSPSTWPPGSSITPRRPASAGIERVGAGCLVEIDDAGAVRAALGAGADPSPDAPTAIASRASTTRSIAPSPAIAPAIGRPARCSAAASTARRSCSAPRRRPSAAPAPLTLFTAGFADAACDERDVAGDRSRRGRRSRGRSPTSARRRRRRTLADDVSTFLAGLDEPVVSSSAYAQWCVMRRVAAAGVRVVLDGQGADELLCGYPALVGPALADDVLGGEPGAGMGRARRARRQGRGIARRRWPPAAPWRCCRSRWRLPPAGSPRPRPPRSIRSSPPAGTRRRRRMPAGAGAAGPAHAPRRGPRAAARGAPAGAAALPRRQLDGLVGRGARAVPRSRRAGGGARARRRRPLARRLAEVGAARSAALAPARRRAPGAAQARLRRAGGGVVARSAAGLAARRAGAGDDRAAGAAGAGRGRARARRARSRRSGRARAAGAGRTSRGGRTRDEAGRAGRLLVSAAAGGRRAPRRGAGPLPAGVRLGAGGRDGAAALVAAPAAGPTGDRDDVPAPALATTDRAWHALAAAAVEALRGSDALEPLKTENVLASRRPHARAAHWLYRHWLSFPDDTWPWLVDRRSVARVFAAHGVEAIVSTSPPPTAHLVAAAAARRLQVPWVADYRDPWSQRSAWRRAWPLAGVEARLERQHAGAGRARRHRVGADCRQPAAPARAAGVGGAERLRSGRSRHAVASIRSRSPPIASRWSTPAR